MKTPVILLFAIFLHSSFAQDPTQSPVTTTTGTTATDAKKSGFDSIVVKESEDGDNDETFKHSVSTVDEKTILAQEASQGDSVNSFDSNKVMKSDQPGSGPAAGSEADNITAAAAATAQASALKYGKTSHATVDETSYHKSAHTSHHKESTFKG